MECVVLAGGAGTRLRTVVKELPKCMAPVAGNPFMYYILRYLGKQGVTHAVLSVGYKFEAIKDWVDSRSWPFKISYAVEEDPLGTGGAIKLALGHCTEDVVMIVNGDTFFDIDLNKLIRAHTSSKAELSVALKPMTSFDRYGNVEFDSNNRITSFREKTFCEQGHINGGTYVINRDSGLFLNLPAKFSFETEVLQRLHADRCFYGFVADGYFIDIGIPDDYHKANIDFQTLFHD